MSMIGYATLGTNDPDKANGFYDAVFAAIGVGRLMTFPTGAIAWGVSWNVPMLAVGRPYDGGPASAGNGTMLALTVDTRAKVDAMHAAALAAGGADEGAPGVRGEEGPQAFYGAYFRDLDGNKLCAFRVGPA
jgi:catechol 2,3-dioxygenase-like lactoylglutathione lyase family enzyme